MKYVQPIGGAVNDPYVDANPVGGIEGSAVPAAAIEHPMREIEAVISGAGLVPSVGDLTQLRQAIAKMIQSGQRTVVIDGVNFAPAVTLTGKAVYWDAANNRFDLALADGSAKQNCVGFADVPNGNVYAFGDAVLFAGLTAGARYYLDAATPGLVTSVAPANAVFVGIARTATELFVDIDSIGGLTQLQADARYCGVGYMLVRDEKAQNTSGGSSAAGVNVRTLNTVVSNTISGASLAADRITLPAGTYRIEASAPYYSTDVCRAYLYNITDASISILGTSEDGLAGASGRSFLTGRLTIPAPKVYELREYIGTAIADGLGKACNQLGVEVYSQVEITKES